MTSKISVGLVGAGAMGGALLNGWLSKGVIDVRRSAVFDPAPGESARKSGLAINPRIDGFSADALVVAVKPQIATEILAELSPAAKGALVISVMAGKSVAGIAALAPAARVVRAMPNLPAAVGKGVAGLYAAPGTTGEDRAVAERLLSAVGDVVWVEEEALIDAVTAVSGSGPAYFLLLAEALAEAGCALGLAEGDAMKLARATLIGAGAYVEQDARPLAELRSAVTSPGGTTEAALKTLDGDEKALRRLIADAVAAARRRAQDLTS